MQTSMPRGFAETHFLPRVLLSVYVVRLPHTLIILPLEVT
jgi:hypothetical protein